jgi:hypothetical protein
MGEARALTRLLATALLVSLLGLSTPAHAAIDRYAVLIGNNVGAADEARLRFAEQDAIKVHDVLKELGQFRPENLLLLRGEGAETVRSALISMNQRLRNRMADGGSEIVLFVYYSGHADAEALHLGRTRLPVRELRELVGGSAATIRLLVMDACRSGALTVAKGGTRAPPLAIEVEPSLGGEGALFLASSAINEDAQESDELRGSFFTHYLTTGLLGGADADRDGRVTLGEAYRFAYEETLRASSRTLAGLQHPTFRYQWSGQGDLVLTDLELHARVRGTLALPAGRGYLVMAGGPDGPIVGEIGPYQGVRQLSVRPGSFFVRGRGSDDLLEGAVALAAGERRSVSEAELTRIRYARLVRKGGGPRSVQGPIVGYRLRTTLGSETGPCYGVTVGYGVELERLSVGGRVNACRASRETAAIEEHADELTASVRLAHAWDLPVLTVDLGAMAGGGVLRQTFTTAGQAPARLSATALIGIGGAISRELSSGFVLSLELAGVTYFYRQQASAEPRPTHLAATFAVETALTVAKRW